MGDDGATSAYRGYRLQLLYTLHTIQLSADDPTLTIHLEGVEDLDILENGAPSEFIQVKSSPNLTLSSLDPQQPGSFFRRAASACASLPRVRVRLVNFGSFGPEMRDAWYLRDERAQQSVRTKLSAYGYTEQEVSWLLYRVELQEVREDELLEGVIDRLREQLAGIDPNAALDLLSFWLYRHAEARATVNHAQVVDEVVHVGRFLAETDVHRREWFTSIVPLEDDPVSEERRSKLKAEFLEGVDARYEHILAGLDFRRTAKLEDIRDAFQRSQVVILHGPSGQGKSTLGYRYMHEYYPSVWRFQVRVVENRRHALMVARALAGHARSVRAPLAVLIDVAPRDTDWPELVKELAAMESVQVLVTIREEDLTRARVSGAWFDFESVELTLAEDEARQLFRRAREAGYARGHLSFEDAWRQFRAGGPLMEFVYLLTHTGTLEERLREQVARIRQDVSKLPGNEPLQVLRLVAVASEYGARVDLVALRRAYPELDLHDLLETYDREYLVRWAPDERYVAGVHPIRSTILTDLLTHPHTEPWDEAIAHVLPLIPEQDLEAFLFHGLVTRPNDAKVIADRATELKPKTWAGMAGVARVLLWLGVKEYVDAISEILDEAHRVFGSALTLAIDFDPLGLMARETRGWWQTLGDLVPEERKQFIRRLRAKQPCQKIVLSRLAAWLGKPGVQPSPPGDPLDWAGVSYVLFWAGRLGLDTQWVQNLTVQQLECAVESLPLPLLGGLSMGLFAGDAERHRQWVDVSRLALERRLANEYGVVYLDRTDEAIKAHFLVPLDSGDPPVSETDGDDCMHRATMERVELVRQLFPGYERYGSQGYGHRFTGLTTGSHDPTVKDIPISWLHLDWEVQPNAWFWGLCDLRHRPATWAEYVEAVLALREQVVSCLVLIERAVAEYMRSDRATNILSYVSVAEPWRECLEAVDGSPSLPEVAVDQWGFVHEGLRDEATTRLDERWESGYQGASLRKYRSYLKSLDSYTSAIRNFLGQAQQVAATNCVAKLRDREARAAGLEELRRLEVRTDLAYLSTYNLGEAVYALEPFQRVFRVEFGSIADADKLLRVEESERQVLPSLWCIWYFYAHQPQKSWIAPSNMISAAVQREERRVWNRLARAIAQIEGASVVVMDGMPNWGYDPTMWLRLEVHSATDLYTAFEQLVYTLRDALGHPSYGELASWLIERRMKYVAIVPVVRGCMMDRMAWYLHSRSAIMAEKDPADHLYAFIPQSIPETLLESLAIPVLDADRCGLAEKLRVSVATASLLCEHVADLNRLPDVTQAGEEFLRVYFSDQAKKISEHLQWALDAAVAMLDYINHLVTRGEETQPSFVAVVQGLSELLTLLTPKKQSDEPGSYLLDLEGIAEFSERLVTARGLAEVVRLYWMADTMDTIS